MYNSPPPHVRLKLNGKTTQIYFISTSNSKYHKNHNNTSQQMATHHSMIDSRCNVLGLLALLNGLLINSIQRHKQK